MESAKGITPHEFEVVAERIDAIDKSLSLSATIISHLLSVVGQRPGLRSK